MKLNKKQEIIIAGVLGAVLLFLVSRLLISGLYSDLTDLRQQIRIAEAQLKKGLRVQKNKDEISASYKQFGPYLRVMGRNERQIFAELLKEIESLVRRVGGIIINLTPQELSDTQETFKEYKVNFRIEVSLAQLLRFFSEIQANKRLIGFEKLTVTAQGDGEDVLMVEGTIGLAVPL